MMKTYQGTRNPYGTVLVDGQPLNPRLDLREHSPTGFEWGYGGSGPAQLALAMLADHFQGWPDGDDRALGLYQGFKWHLVSLLAPEWTLTSDDIDVALSELEAMESPS